MKYPVYKLIAAFVLALSGTGCLERDTPVPLMQADEVQLAIAGRWTIRKIAYQLCRDRNCTASTYTGLANDYFEFRADSAFLVLTDRPLQQQNERFKASYNLQGSVVLTKGEWSGRFEVKEVKPESLVLISSFTGRDPNAVFSDTYYLSR